jgi:hypothetical protein
MASKKYTLKKGQWTDQVINILGVDKNLPSGNVTVVHNADGSLAGYLQDGALYAPGEKAPKKTPDSNDLFDTLEAEKVKARRASAIIDNATPGSSEFVNATNDFAAANKKAAALQKQYEDTKAAEKTAAAGKKQAATNKSTTTLAQAAIDEATAAKQRALAKNPNADVKSYDTIIQGAKNQISQANAPVAGQSPIEKGAAALGTSTAAAAAVGPNYKKAPPAISGGAATVVPSKTLTPGKTPGKTSGVVIPTADQVTAAAHAALQAMGATAGGYTVQMGLIESDPSLKELFYNDVYLPISQGKAPVAAAKFQADLLNTKWYNSYIEPAREAEAIKYGDPATWAASVESATTIVRNSARDLGYDISPEQIATTVDMFLHKAGGKAESLVGLPLAELKTYITSVGKLNASGGLAASGIANLKSIAADYGVAHLFGAGDDWFKTQQDAILKGTTTQAAVEQAIKTAAKSSYGALSSQIDAGLTVKSILSPYANLTGSILEIDPNAQDISDPKFASNVFIQDPADPSKQILKPLWQYQQDLKKDPRWAYTNNARADLDSTAHSVLTSLGLTY